MAQAPPSTSYDAAAVYLLLEKSQDIYNLISPYLYMLAGILPKCAINAGLPLSAHIPKGDARDRLATRVYPSILEAVDASRKTEDLATELSVGMIVDAIECLHSRTSHTTVRHLIIVATSAPNMLEEGVKPVSSTSRTVCMELAQRMKQANIMLHMITSPGDRLVPLWALFDECVQCSAFAEDTLPFAIDRSRVEMRLSAAIIRPADTGNLVESGCFGGAGKLSSPAASQSRKTQRGRKQRYEPYISQSRVTMAVSPMDVNLVEQIQMRFGLHHGKRGRKESRKASESFCRNSGLSGIAATKDIFIPDVTLNINHRRATAEPAALISPRTTSGQFALHYQDEPVDDSPSVYLPVYRTPEVMVAPSAEQVYVPHRSREPTPSTLPLPQSYAVPHPSPVVSTPVVTNQPPSVDQYWDHQYAYMQVSLDSPTHASGLVQTPTTAIYKHEDISHTDSFGHGTFDMAINHTSSYTTEAAPVNAQYDPDMTASFGYDPTQFEVIGSAGPSPSASTPSYSLLTPDDDGAYHLTSGQSLVLPSNSNTGVRDFVSQPSSPCQTKTTPLESPAQPYDSSRDNEPFTFTADYFTATDALAMKYFQVNSSGTNQFIEGDDRIPIIGPPPSDTTGAIYNSHFSSGQQSSPITLSNFTSYTLGNAISYAAMGWAA